MPYVYWAWSLSRLVSLRAVLRPISRSKPVRPAVLRTRFRWRRRAAKLLQAKHFNEKVHSGCRYCRPCTIFWRHSYNPPAGISVMPERPDRFGCSQTHICPFCYGRAIESLSRRVFAMIDQHQPLGGFYVYELSNSATSRAQNVTGAIRKRTIEKAAHPFLRRNSRGEARTQVAGVLAYHWRNSFRRKDGIFSVKNRLLVFSDRQIPELAGERVYHVQCRRDVIRPLVRHLRYDTYLLGDPVEDVRWILKTFNNARVRWSRRGGLLQMIGEADESTYSNNARVAERE